MEELPFNLQNILYGKTVENFRIEYKKCISDQNELQVGATLCAFANDYLNQNGGWLIIGIEANDGVPVLPLEEAKVLREQWRKEYNQVRPHSARNNRPPAPETILTAALT